MKQLAAKTVSAESGSTLRTLINLKPYMWPAERPDLRMRVVWATIYLVVAKLVLVAVPYFFKWATDTLAGDAAKTPPLPDWLLVPAALVIAYNLVRIIQLGLNQFRDSLFASVGQYAVRKLVYRNLFNMHDL